MRHIYRVLLLVFSLLILGLIILASNPYELAKKLASSNPIYIFAALLVSSVANVFRVLKWSVLVRVGVKELFPIQMLGMAVSNFTPAKAGEPAKSLLLKMKSGISVSQSLQSIIWERINDLLVLLLFSFLIINFLSLKQDLFLLAAAGMSVFTVLIITLVVALKSRRLGMRLFSLVRRAPLGNRIPETFADAFYKSSTQKKRIVLGFLLTLVPWALEGVVLHLSFLSLGIDSPGIAVLSGMIALSALLGVASTLPGGLGSFEAIILVLLSAFAITGSSAVAGVLLYRFMSFWYVTLLGAVSFMYLTGKIRK